MEGIDIDDLPPTFRDAVTVVRKLGLRYLWIDSLCIIQKDLEDWQIESARMSSIFRNAYLVLGAASGYLIWPASLAQGAWRGWFACHPTPLSPSACSFYLPTIPGIAPDVGGPFATAQL